MNFCCGSSEGRVAGTDRSAAVNPHQFLGAESTWNRGGTEAGPVGDADVIGPLDSFMQLDRPQSTLVRVLCGSASASDTSRGSSLDVQPPPSCMVCSALFCFALLCSHLTRIHHAAVRASDQSGSALVSSLSFDAVALFARE